MTDQFDLIIIGTGAGGGTLAHQLAPTGARILLLERGDWLPREPQNWLGQGGVVDGRYVSPDTWHYACLTPFQPQVHYFVGGATKLSGGALYRLRQEDFGKLLHHGGVSPAWPISYEEIEPYSTRAEQLYMFHNSQAVLALSREENPTVFQKTLGVNDFYVRGPDFQFPLGNIQMVGKSQAPMFRGEKPGETRFAPTWSLRDIARHAVDFWLSTEDLPSPENRVTLARDGRIVIDYRPSNEEPKRRLYHQLKAMLADLGMHDGHLLPHHAYLKNDIPVAGVAHQAGTCRFGGDPATSVLDTDCRAHEV